MTPSGLRKHMNNNIDIEGILKSSMNIVGLRNTECLNSDFIIEVNYAWMHVWTNDDTNFNGIKELKDGDYVHIKALLRTESTCHTDKMEEIILGCKEICFTGNRKEFMKYKGLS